MNDMHKCTRYWTLSRPLNVQQSVLACTVLTLHEFPVESQPKSEHCQLDWHAELLSSARPPEQALPGGLALWQSLLAAPILEIIREEF